MEPEPAGDAVLIVHDRVRQVQTDRHINARHHDAEAVADAHVRGRDRAEVAVRGVADVAEECAAEDAVDRVGRDFMSE